MKRIATFALCLLLCIWLCIPAMAANEAQWIRSDAQVGEDGNCRLTLAVTLRLDTPVAELTFPLPADAQNVLLDGNGVTTRHSGGLLLVQLPNFTAGDHRFTLTYTLKDVISRENGDSQLNIPLLSGFSYPIQAMEISIVLPGAIDGTPTFISGYYQEDIHSSLVCSVTGNTLSASLQAPLKDHETLTLTLPVNPEHFSMLPDLTPAIDPFRGIVLVCVALSVLYYLLTLMPQLHRRSRCFGPPDGISAGEVGVCLTGTGLDLTLMVLTWAQLGYVQLEQVNSKRVVLHKKMEMGNERKPSEVQAFQALFRNRPSLDGCGIYYAKLCRRLSQQAPLQRELFRPNSGKPMLFRLLSCAAGCASGVQLGLSVTDHGAGRVLLGILIGFFCFAFSYFIQSGGKTLPLRDKTPLLLSIGCGGIWIALSAITGQLGSALPMVLYQFVCGIALAFGGRRSELGKRSFSQLWGLRHYMVRANSFELQQRLQANGNYFFELAPYALALGVDKRFARRFGKVKLPECGFLTTRESQPTTAGQWAALLRQVADALNNRQRRLAYERIAKK